MGWGKPAYGGTVLRIPAEQSPNFQTGVSGWKISIDGSAEFNNLTIRGTFLGADFILNSAGAFFYNGTPALGNLIASIASVSGTDQFGNVYLAGIDVYGTDGTFLEMLAGAPASLFIGSGDTAEDTPARLLTQISGAGPTRKIATTLRAPRVTGENANAACSVVLISPSVDLTQRALVSLVASDDGVNFGTVNIGQTGIVLSNGTSVQMNSGTGSVTLTPTSVTVANVPLIATAGTASAPNQITTDSWHTLAPANGWANQGGGLAQLQYLMLSQQEVWVIGVLNPSAFTSTTIATLPSGYRPIGAAMEDSFEFHTAAGAGSGCFLRIGTNGVMQAINGVTTMGAVGINTRLSLLTIT